MILLSQSSTWPQFHTSNSTTIIETTFTAITDGSIICDILPIAIVASPPPQFHHHCNNSCKYSSITTIPPWTQLLLLLSPPHPSQILRFWSPSFDHWVLFAREGRVLATAKWQFSLLFIAIFNFHHSNHPFHNPPTVSVSGILIGLRGYCE